MGQGLTSGSPLCHPREQSLSLSLKASEAVTSASCPVWESSSLSEKFSCRLLCVNTFREGECMTLWRGGHGGTLHPECLATGSSLNTNSEPVAQVSPLQQLPLTQPPAPCHSSSPSFSGSPFHPEFGAGSRQGTRPCFLSYSQESTFVCDSVLLGLKNVQPHIPNFIF